MKTAARIVTFVLALAFVMPSALAEQLWQPVPTSPNARRLLRERMKDHAREMDPLLWAVLFLDYDAVVRAAATIARNAKPLDRNDLELEPHIQFFALQMELRARALNLVDSAHQRDGLRVASSFNQMSETCVHCHVLYLEPSPIKPRRPAP